MMPVRGPRPWSIQMFALAFTVQAIATFGQDITHLAQTKASLAATFPDIAFDRDLTIITTSARLSIALIPVAMVWFLASRLARWLIVMLALGKTLMTLNITMFSVPHELVTPLAFGSLLLSLGGAALLLTPGATRWFAHRPRQLPGSIN